MAGEQQNDLVLRLRDIEELFIAPALDPLNGQFHSMSGIDQILVKLRPRALDQTSRLIILLPPDQLSDDLEKRCKEALRGFCADRLQAIDLEKAQLNRQGFKELKLGLMFLAICLLVSSSIAARNWGPQLLSTFLIEGFVIVGWIALWHPVDLLLFSRWTLVRDQRVLEHIRDLPLNIQAA